MILLLLGSYKGCFFPLLQNGFAFYQNHLPGGKETRLGVHAFLEQGLYSLGNSTDRKFGKGVAMYTNDLNNAYIYETQRRRDEMADAVNCHLISQCSGIDKKKFDLFAYVPSLVLAFLTFFIKS